MICAVVIKIFSMNESIGRRALKLDGLGRPVRGNGEKNFKGNTWRDLSTYIFSMEASYIFRLVPRN